MTRTTSRACVGRAMRPRARPKRFEDGGGQGRGRVKSLEHTHRKPNGSLFFYVRKFREGGYLARLRMMASMIPDARSSMQSA